MANRANRPRDYYLPVGLFILVLTALILLLVFTNPAPKIARIDPDRAVAGEVVTIFGSNFGETRGRSYVELAGQEPTSSRYQLWQEDRIELVVPSGATSGLLYVVTGGGRSNPVLYTNATSEPQAQSTLDPGPRLELISPVEISIGEALTVRGSGFGRRQADSSIYFTPFGGSDPTLPVDAAAGGYLFWSDQEVRVRVPGGAGSGAVALHSRRGTVESESLTVQRPAGTLRHLEPREYALRQEVRLHSFSENRRGEIFLWLPDVQSAPAQRQVQLLDESVSSRLEFQNQARLYAVSPPELIVVEDQEEAATARPEERIVSRTFLFERYAVSVEIDPDRVPREYTLDPSFIRRYTRSEVDLPVGEPAVAAFAAESVGRVTNRLEQARWIYRETVGLLEPATDVSGGALDALASANGDAWGYTTLAVSALRQVGIPARPVSGVLLLDEVRSVRHHWVEFFLQDFGWVPMDPALGDLLYADQQPPLPEESTAEEFYFASLDNRRAAFSFGEISTPSMEMGGGAKVPEAPYSRQRTYEEATPSVGSYSSNWMVPQLIGSY